MTQTEAEQLLADLRAQYAAQAFDPEKDVTLRQLCEVLGLSRSGAAARMKVEEGAGRVEKRTVCVGGKWCAVWRKA